MAVALVAGAVALVSAAVSLWGQGRTARLASSLEDLRAAQKRRVEVEQAVARYREPLARAAYDLQSRFYNIIEQGLLDVYYARGDERERSYVVDNTAFVVAQYFGWTEAVRRDIQFIDLGRDEQTRHLAHLQDEIHALFQTDLFDRSFRVFAGEQRAIGERMLTESSRGLTCLGYASFLDKLSEGTDRLLDSLRADIRALSGAFTAAQPRLVAIQNALIELLAFLDPAFTRFPKDRRSKAHTG